MSFRKNISKEGALTGEAGIARFRLVGRLLAAFAFRGFGDHACRLILLMAPRSVVWLCSHGPCWTAAALCFRYMKGVARVGHSAPSVRTPRQTPRARCLCPTARIKVESVGAFVAAVPPSQLLPMVIDTLKNKYPSKSHS